MKYHYVNLHPRVSLYPLVSDGCLEINHKQGQVNLWEVCPAHGGFVYWGVFVCVNARQGLSKAQPSFITVKALPEGETAHPLFPQTDRKRERREGFTLASGFWVQPQHNVLWLSLSLSLSFWLSFSHTHPASGWTLIWLWLETGAQRREGKAFIFTGGELGGGGAM